MSSNTAQTVMRMEARLKCGIRPGRWRPVRSIRTTNDQDDCRGGGVPIGVKVIFYADAPRGLEGWYDFEWNVEMR